MLGAFIIVAALLLLYFLWPLALIFLGICVICGIGSDIQAKMQARQDRKNAAINEKIKQIISLYRPSKLNHPTDTTPISLSVNAELINKEVVKSVHKYKSVVQPLIEQCSAIDRQLTDMLAYNSAEDNPNEKLEYLTNNNNELRKLKLSSDSLHEEIHRSKIQITNENNDLMASLHNAFTSLQSSKKVTSRTSNIQTFLSPKTPQDLSIFSFNHKPVICYFDNFFFCFFSNIILVFDQNGIFSTALDPSSLVLDIHKECVDLYVHSSHGSLQQHLSHHKLIGEDSKCIRRGTSNTTWRYTCRDGTPDLRYSNNSRIVYHTDTYEYVVLSLTIANKEISFTASSQIVASEFEKIKSTYVRKCNHLHDPIPDLLLLLKTLNRYDNTHINTITKNYAERSHSNSYFTQLTLPSHRNRKRGTHVRS